MNVSSQAAEEMIRMVYSGGMIVFRASKSALRTTQKIIAQLAVKHYKVRGKQSLYRMLKKNRTIQTYSLSLCPPRPGMRMGFSIGTMTWKPVPKM